MYTLHTCAAAYHTLKDCAEQKGALSAKIEATNEKIRAKRKQLESLREELTVLGECVDSVDVCPFV